mmetsp:Transcript_5509/g.14112  ORF Transcript_5509/g.14112 Transcript_5509/m.14112 type:complete len:225 (+) Transcript_5509:157-831(+)
MLLRHHPTIRNRAPPVRWTPLPARMTATLEAETNPCNTPSWSCHPTTSATVPRRRPLANTACAHASRHGRHSLVAYASSLEMLKRSMGCPSCRPPSPTPAACAGPSRRLATAPWCAPASTTGVEHAAPGVVMPTSPSRSLKWGPVKRAAQADKSWPRRRSGLRPRCSWPSLLMPTRQTCSGKCEPKSRWMTSPLRQQARHLLSSSLGPECATTPASVTGACPSS